MARRFNLKARLARAGAGVVFGATLGAILLVSGVRGIRQVNAVGFAEAQAVEIAPMEAARVAAVRVGAGQHVEAGQVVAQLDTTTVDREIAVATAELLELEATLHAEVAAARKDALLDARAFAEDVDGVESALAEARQTAEVARATAEQLRPTLARQRALVEGGLATRELLGDLELKLAEAEAELRASEALVAVLEGQRGASARRQGVYQGLDQDAAEPIRRSIEVVSRQIELLEARREGLTLRAPTSGLVSLVLRPAGEVVAAGESVLLVVADRVASAVACVKESDGIGLSVGMEARVWPAGSTGEGRRAVLASLGPMMLALPPECPSAGVLPVRGRLATLRLDDVAGIVPGQSLHVRFSRRDPEPAAAPSPSAPGQPQVMQMPPALSAMTPFEPSGLVWVEELDRYLVVSDDTGRDEAKTSNAPWLFSVSRDGAVDPSPLVVQDVASLRDLEAVASDPSGQTLYLLSSQSLSRKGKRHADRTTLSRVERRGSLLRAVSHPSLFDALEAMEPEERAALGLGPDWAQALDLEGLAWQGGALYLGLKAPLSSAGRALIWRMAHPDVFFASGSLSGAGLERWAEAPLTALAGDREVPGGVSDLMFGPAGELILTSTPSAAEADAGVTGAVSGRLWMDPKPAGGLAAPRLMRTFHGLKPEGVSAAPADGRLIVVFDEGDASPRWLEMPWPDPTVCEGSCSAASGGPSSVSSPTPRRVEGDAAVQR